MSEALCCCGHDVAEHGALHGCHHMNYGSGCEVHVCSCRGWTPPPTREPIRLTAEAEAAWREWIWSPRGRALIPYGTTDRDRECFLAGFRAARLDELEHEVEGLAWRNQQLTERLEQYTMTDPIDLNARREQRVPEPDGEPAIVMPMDTDEIIFRDQAALDEYVAGAIRAARLAGEDDRP